MAFVNNLEIGRSPKTGKPRYRCRYDVYVNGKRSRRRTSWCSTEEAARHEAERKRTQIVSDSKKDERRIRDKAISTYFTEYEKWIEDRPLDSSFSASERRSCLQRLRAIRRAVNMKNLTAGSIDARDVHLWGTQLAEYVSPRTGQVISAAYYNLLAIEVNKFVAWLNERLRKPLPSDARIPMRKKAKTRQDRHLPDAEKWAYYTHAEWQVICKAVGFLPAETALPEANKPLLVKDFLTAEQYGWLVLNVLYYTGMRAEEMRELRWRDIDFVNHAIRVERADAYRMLAKDRQQYLGLLDTKNEYSKRKIVMFHASYQDDDYCNVEAYFAVLWHAFSMGMGSDEERGRYLLNRRVLPSRTRPDGPYTPHPLDEWLRSFAAKTGLKRINTHGLRKSYAEYQARVRHIPRDLLVLQMGHVDEKMLDEVYQPENIEDKFERVLAWEKEHE